MDSPDNAGTVIIAEDSFVNREILKTILEDEDLRKYIL